MSIEASQRRHATILRQVGGGSLEVHQRHQHNSWASCNIFDEVIQVSVNSHANWLRSGKGGQARVHIRCCHLCSFDVLGLRFRTDKNGDVSEDHLRRVEGSGSGRAG